MFTVAIDPGVQKCGVAIFYNGELYTAALVKSERKDAHGAQAWRPTAEAAVKFFADVCRAVRDGHRVVLVVERPQVYQARRVAADANDLIDLAGVLGAIDATLKPDEIVEYKPREWKGTVPKHVMTERIKGWLRPGELERIVGKLDHNVLDAVGLGINHLEGKQLRVRTAQEG